MRILAIDPGPTFSAYAVFEDGEFITAAKVTSEEMLEIVINGLVVEYERLHFNHIAIEMIASFGMAVGQEVFETCVWIGRFIEAFDARCTRLLRKEIVLHLCNSPRAGDSNIRQAIIDRFGGKDVAIGRKKAPGPLYGVSGDMWSAIAVGLTYLETKSDAPQRLN